MKRVIIATVLAALAACSCTQAEPEVIEVEKEVAVEPLASYGFDGKDYSVHSLILSYYEEYGYLEFYACREPEKPYSSYVVIGIPEENLGKTLDFSNLALMNRLDYFIQFEDTMHYYPAEYAPKSGTLLVEESKDGYHVKLDARLADGKPLFFEYDGKFELR